MVHDKAHSGDCAMPEHLRGVHHDLPPPCEACNGQGMVGRPLDDDPGLMCLDCRGTGRAHVVKSRDVDNKDVVAQRHPAVEALQSIPGYPFLPCPICHGIEGCDHSVPERVGGAILRAEIKAIRSEVQTEELTRGMTEMAERFTARMDGAAAQIDELRECLILTLKELDTISHAYPLDTHSN